MADVESFFCSTEFRQKVAGSEIFIGFSSN